MQTKQTQKATVHLHAGLAPTSTPVRGPARPSCEHTKLAKAAAILRPASPRQGCPHPHLPQEAQPGVTAWHDFLLKPFTLPAKKKACQSPWRCSQLKNYSPSAVGLATAIAIHQADRGGPCAAAQEAVPPLPLHQPRLRAGPCLRFQPLMAVQAELQLGEALWVGGPWCWHLPGRAEASTEAPTVAVRG